MSGPIIWGGSNNVGLLLPAVPSAGVITTDALGNLGVSQTQPGSLQYWSGYFTQSPSIYWATSSTTYANPTLTGSPTFTTRKNNVITATAAASSACGIQFTPPSVSAVYLVTFSLPLYQNSVSNFVMAQITDGTNIIGTGEFYQSPSAANASASINITGIYAPATTSAVNLYAQLVVNSGSGYIGSINSNVNIEITITRIDTLVQSGAAITRNVQSISSPTTLPATAGVDQVALVSGTTTVTLPSAVSNLNLYTVKNTGVNTVSIATTSAQTIDGSASPITLPVANTSLDLISDGANWRIV